MRTVGIITTALFVIVFSAIFDGFVLSVLWGWFIVPAFHVSQLTLPLAIGVSMVVAMLTNRTAGNSREQEKDKKDIGETLLSSFFIALLVPLITLGISAIVHLFV